MTGVQTCALPISGDLFALANLTLQFADAGLLRRRTLHFQLLQFTVKMVDLFHSAFNLAGEITPLGNHPRHAANRQRSFHQRPRQLHGELAAQFLVDGGGCLQLFSQLHLLLVV